MVQRAKSLTDQVLDELLDDIVQGRRASGTLLSEKAVATEFGVSKTPVREAFVQLQSLGLVEVLPQRGCLVFQPTAAQVRALCETRTIIEGAAIRLALQRDRDGLVGDLERALKRMERRLKRPVDGTSFGQEDRAFHRAFFERSGNPSLREAHGLFGPRLQALRTNLQSADGYLLGQAQDDHTRIVDAVRIEDADAAVAALAVHVERMATSYETETGLLQAAE